MQSPSTTNQDVEPPSPSRPGDEPPDPYVDTRKPGETIPEFLARLPPVPTDAKPATSDWYSVNPEGCDVGKSVCPPDYIARRMRLEREGKRMLQRFKLALDSNAGNELLCARLREDLKKELEELARETGMTTGKVRLGLIFIAVRETPVASGWLLMGFWG